MNRKFIVLKTVLKLKFLVLFSLFVLNAGNLAFGQSPGGVSTDLSSWYKADNNVTLMV